MRGKVYRCYKCGRKLKWLEILVCRRCRKAGDG